MRELNSLVVYGHAGTGKTTSVAMAMPNALWVVTRKSNLSGYNSFLRNEPEKAAALGLKPIPENRVIQVPSMEVNKDTGIMQRVSTREFIDKVVSVYCLKVLNNEIEVDGIVFDEFSVFCKRVFEEMTAADRNGFNVIRNFKRWVGDMCEIPVATDKPMCLICHAQDPKYDESGNTLKYKGGPAMPIGTVVAEVCALPDAVLQLEVKKGGAMDESVTRVLKTEAHPEWERKCRLWGVAPEIEPDLRSLLQQAGW